MNRVMIGTREISSAAPTFVIAEIGLNHEGDASMAEALVRSAAQAGADAVKFQTYVSEKRVAASHPFFSLFKRCELDLDAHRRLQRLAGELGVTFFSTPFDEESVDLLQQLDVPVFKVASFDATNHALLRRVAATGKPVLLSRGACNEQEIQSAVDIFTSAGSPLALLHCVSAYPTPLADANLLAIRSLARRYDCPVGYSDHTLGISAATWAVAVGARVLEKHFTLDKSLPGPDHAMSADPSDLRALVDAVRQLEGALGLGALGPLDVEAGIFAYRRHSS